MSGQPSGSGANSAVPKAIGSLAKRQTDVTRQGTQKLKFVPTLPSRRKKDAEVKSEPATLVAPSDSDRTRGRGRGRGADPRGRGTSTTARIPVEMTASGPFAMGPSMTVNAGKRIPPRSNPIPATQVAPGSSTVALGSGLSRSAAPSLKTSGGEENVLGNKARDEDIETYSDPDEGVEIIDMENVRQMDWMAPDGLQKSEGKKRKSRIKKEDGEAIDLKGKGKASEAPGIVDSVNALDLSDSEEEEGIDDLTEDFLTQPGLYEGSDIHQEQLYFFQFPSPFPVFHPPSTSIPGDSSRNLGTTGKIPDMPLASPKKVSFAPDSVPDLDAEKDNETPAPMLNGVIGQLEIYQSGAVKMRLGNDMLYDVAAATQSSFLQHAVHLDMPNKRLCVLGEISKRFVVSPNIEALLAAMEQADEATQREEGMAAS